MAEGVSRLKQLQRALRNLLRNSVEAIEAARRPEGEGRVVLRTTVADEMVRLEIEDNGCGIKPEDLDKVFAYGFTTRRNGSGFGLHSAAISAKRMGGKLLATSPGPGQGATFVLEIPLDCAQLEGDLLV